jgi:hypothetical protein
MRASYMVVYVFRDLSIDTMSWSGLGDRSEPSLSRPIR